MIKIFMSCHSHSPGLLRMNPFGRLNRALRSKRRLPIITWPAGNTYERVRSIRLPSRRLPRNSLSYLTFQSKSLLWKCCLRSLSAWLREMPAIRWFSPPRVKEITICHTKFTYCVVSSARQLCLKQLTSDPSALLEHAALHSQSKPCIRVYPPSHGPRVSNPPTSWTLGTRRQYDNAKKLAVVAFLLLAIPAALPMVRCQ